MGDYVALASVNVEDLKNPTIREKLKALGDRRTLLVSKRKSIEAKIEDINEEMIRLLKKSKAKDERIMSLRWRFSKVVGSTSRLVKEKLMANGVTLKQIERSTVTTPTESYRFEVIKDKDEDSE